MRAPLFWAFLVAILLPSPLWADRDDNILCAQSAKFPDLSIAACTRLASSKLPNVDLSAIYNNRGVAWYFKGRFDTAVSDFTQAIDLKPEFAIAYLNRGRAWRRLKDPTKALADFSTALQADPNNADARSERAAALFDQGEIESAIADYDELIRLRPDYVRAYISQAACFVLKYEFDKALAQVNEAMRRAPDDLDVHHRRAELLIQKNDFEAALAEFEAILRLDPKDWRAFTERGELRRLRQQLSAALEDQNYALKIKPDSSVILAHRGDTFKDMGDFERAIADTSRAILLDSTNADAFATRGEVWRLKSNFARAKKDLNRAIELQPKDPENLRLRANVWLDEGALDLALADYDAALRLRPHYVAAIVGRGRVYEAKRDNLTATRLYQQALSLPSADPHTSIPAQSDARSRLNEFQRIEQAEASAKEEARSLASAKQLSEIEAKARAEAETKAKLEYQQRLAAEILARNETAAFEARNKQAVEEARLASEVGIRVALVIGNSTYEAVPMLPNPQRDAEAVAAAFKKLGFQTVIQGRNLTRAEFLSKIREFEDLAAAADWAVIFYAGHGLEMNGLNYLLPIDVRLLSDRDVQDEAISLDRMLQAAERAKKLRLVILDSCRDNPFLSTMRRTVATRSIGRGLARIDPEVGTLVAYAAREGQISRDGNGDHSPFTTSFLKNIVDPKLEINMLFRRVRDEVLQETQRRQEPFMYGSLPGESFYFAIR
ncbi:tetratricopeptide repeat protein [Bradyrhizobium sp. Arg68]|uniref:tetratricopeptide repeat protein n=1 Tax=Bradyrhizobium ivorense TaxID=2511166 RepID=UPI001E39F164|nr:tetratricopeptide repeat protein [Bradyrhizobium ivorense]MCC8943093.1 tetratricopeptide repeat protein [Bradyrhizobium ivorense]